MAEIITFTNQKGGVGKTSLAMNFGVRLKMAGARVLFVDMDGKTWHYEVSAGEVLQPTQIEKMTVKSSGDDWDLTLFTCTTGGQARYALRCVRTDP